MKDIRMILPNPASDTAGAASALFQLNGLSIIHDAAGSMESYITFDESRQLQGKRTVASRLSRLEAITGDDQILLNKIETECEASQPPFIAIFGSPIPFTIGTDLDGIASEAQFTTGIPAFAVSTGGFDIYDKGAGEALKKVLETLTKQPVGHSGKIINLLGATPMDYSPAEIEEISQHLLAQGADQIHNLTMTDGVEQICHAAEADHNVVISMTGLPAARYLKQRYGMPYSIGLPLDADILADWAPSSPKKVLIIGETVFTKQMAQIIGQVPNVTAVAGIINGDDAEVFPDVKAIKLYTEDSIRQEVRRDYDVIIADPMYQWLMKKDPQDQTQQVKQGQQSCMFLERPHRALSGRLYPFSEYKLNHYLTRLKECLT